MKSRSRDSDIYILCIELGEKIWSIVLKWDSFARDTVGKQWVIAIDSVGAHISEWYGGYSYIEMRKSIYIARDSMSEHITWVTKAGNRGPISLEYNVNIVNAARNPYLKINNCLKYMENLIRNKHKQQRTTTV